MLDVLILLALIACAAIYFCPNLFQAQADREPPLGRTLRGTFPDRWR